MTDERNPDLPVRQVGPSAAYLAAAAWLVPSLMVLTKQRWTGGHHLPNEGGFLVCANHTTYIDPLAVAHYLWGNGHAGHFLAKAGLFDYPVIGAWLRGCGQVPVYRGSGRAIEAYADAVSAIERGKCVVIMPEATITRDPELWPMIGKSGAARIALTTRCPVIPVAQWGPHELLEPYGRPHPFPRKTMRVQAGPAIDLHDLYGRKQEQAVLREATERIMEGITTELESLRGIRAPRGRWDQRVRARVDPRVGPPGTSSRGRDEGRDGASEYDGSEPDGTGFDGTRLDGTEFDGTETED